MTRRLLVALLLALAPEAALAVPLGSSPLVAPAIQYTPPSGSHSTVQSELDWAHGQNIWRSIVARSSMGPSNYYQTGGWQSIGTWRMNFVVAGTLPVTYVKAKWCNVISSNGEVVPSNPITVTASLETNSAATKVSWSYNDGGRVTPVPFRFNGGATSVVIQPARCVESDPLPILLSPRQGFYIVDSCSEPIGKICPTVDYGGISGQTNYDGNNLGYSSTAITGNGTTGPYAYNVPAGYYPVVPGSLYAYAGSGFSTTHDNGSGGCAANQGVASCTINYSTGNVSIIFAAPIASGTLLYQGTFGGTSTDQTLTTLTAFGLATGVNPTFGPQEVVGTTFGGRTRTIGLSGDSIMTGNVNTQQNVSWADLSNGGLYGEVKISSPGETLAKWATPAGRIGRTALVGPGGADRILSNYGTNDITGGASLSTMINGFLASIPALAAMTPNSDPDNIWWVTLLPHVVSAVSNVPYAPSTGPYQAAGAALGPGAVANPTPLGAGVLTCTITGTGSAGPYSCPFGQATMIGALWSDGAYTTVIDTGSGGASATTLSGSLVSTGSNTPATGAVSLTFASALAGGQTVNLYTFASGPSERNAWNYFLYNWAVPKGKIGGVIDTASCVEASPASATGAGSGTWSSLSLTADGTHPNAAGHQTAIPGCIGPSGTTPSLFWNIY